MYISKFQIQNFKSFEDVTFLFNEKVNVLTGLNNVGKTTILEAVSLWQECYGKLVRRAGKQTKGLYRQNDYTFGVKTGIYVPYHEIISVRSPNYKDIFRNLDDSQDNKICLTATLTLGDKDLLIKICIYPGSGDNYRIFLENYEHFDYTLFNDTNFINNPETVFSSLFASPVANILAQEERLHSLKIAQQKLAHQSQLVVRNRIESVFQRSNEINSPFQSFCNNLSAVLYDKPNEVKFEFPDPTKLDLKVLIKLNGEVPKDISLVGSGTLQIIEILLNVHEQKSDMNTILLDEPDSHIHRLLQRRLLNILAKTPNTQVFMTTHNEALIRDANPNWVFHLEQKSKKTTPYQPIERNRTGKPVGLLSSAVSPVIQTLTGNGTGLDFVNALEADVLFLVEGVNDALRIQKILSLQIGNTKKYAFWLLGSVDEIFDKIIHYKTIFQQIKNEKSLWDKTVLVFDKDYLTDTQREKLLLAFVKKLEIKNIHIWASYHFESTLFTDLDELTRLLSKYIGNLDGNADTIGLRLILEKVMREKAVEITILCEEANIKKMEAKVSEQIVPRRKKLEEMGLKDVIDADRNFLKTIDAYWRASTEVKHLHKIMNKEDCQFVLEKVFNHFNIEFKMEGLDSQANFNGLFDCIDQTTTYKDWEFIFNQ
jgi:ABC-type lipoprotein export system ATPase subunit